MKKIQFVDELVYGRGQRAVVQNIVMFTATN
jgi:hypothetical protein